MILQQHGYRTVILVRARAPKRVSTYVIQSPPHPGVPTLDAGEKKFNSRLVALCYSTCFGPKPQDAPFCLPLIPLRLDQLFMLRHLEFAAERLSPSARERVPGAGRIPTSNVLRATPTGGMDTVRRCLKGAEEHHAASRGKPKDVRDSTVQRVVVPSLPTLDSRPPRSCSQSRAGPPHLPSSTKAHPDQGCRPSRYGPTQSLCPHARQIRYQPTASSGSLMPWVAMSRLSSDRRDRRRSEHSGRRAA